MNDLHSGLDGLDRAQDALAAFESRFASIEALCAECASLVDAKDSIRRLGAVHSNVRQTLHSAETVATLPRQAAEAESLLETSNDSASSLLRAYLTLAELEATVVKVKHALDAFKSQQVTATLQVPSLEFYFAQVHRAMAKVEERVWSTIRSFQTVAQRNPSMLVAALQVIEIQEGVDRELLAAGQGGSKLRKGWRTRCMQQLSASLQESFAPLLQRCSKIMAEDAAVEDLLKKVLDEANSLIYELKKTRDVVVPCFPPHYAVLFVICNECNTHVGSMLDLVGLSANRLSNGDILLCMKWVEAYNKTMNLIYNSSTTNSSTILPNSISTSTFSGVSLLLEKYISRVAATLESWLSNIVEQDFSGEPAISQDGKLWTPGPVDLFRILDEQLGVAASAGGVLVKRVAAEAARMLRSFQQLTRGKVAEKEHPIEILCAVANNSQRCRSLGLEFVTRLTDLLMSNSSSGGGGGDGSNKIRTSPSSQQQQGEKTPGSTTTTTSITSVAEADLQNACSSFLDIGDVALSSCVETVFGDPGFADLFGRVGYSDGWLSGTVTGSVLATLDDFMHDFETWLQPQLYRRLVDLLLKETTAHFIAAITMQLRSVAEPELKALRRDVAKIKSFFGGLISTDRAAVECQPLLDIIDFLASDSVESFTLSYSTLLETAPGISPVLLSNLLTARVASDEDMTKADAKEVMEACRLVFAGKKQPNSGGGAGGGSIGSHSAPVVKRKATAGNRALPGSRDAAFMAALNAARRRPDTPT
jgi:exocyst complex component 3